ncbi:unnamed protein product, partial [Trichogramma brassicae]
NEGEIKCVTHVSSGQRALNRCDSTELHEEWKRFNFAFSAASTSLHIQPTIAIVRRLDYAGPLPVLFSRGRKAPSTKGYIAIFICMVVRAVHVEVVSDLTTGAFLAAFSRFCARRGRPAVLYSDNATTFKGAARELRELFSEGSNLTELARNFMQKRGTVWKFIPPRAPHFGGLWEAAVRGFKHHFRRVIGDARLTFEELSTVAARIEACLNSRPLCPRSSRPEDFEALTPAHFLVGTSLLDYPEPCDNRTLSFTNRWRLLRGMRDMFWSRWRQEVLSQMQQRSKWLTARESLQPGDMVLLRDDLCTPSSWPLARVVQVHPGSDGLDWSELRRSRRLVQLSLDQSSN